MKPTKSTSWFARFAKMTARKTGQPITFVMAISIIIIWIVRGSIFKFSDTWQLDILTGTTIVTFLLVFLIQNTQNRDSLALQVKLDELIYVIEGVQTRYWIWKNWTRRNSAKIESTMRNWQNRAART
jgi:low affinity Fe/Cu permease